MRSLTRREFLSKAAGGAALLSAAPYLTQPRAARAADGGTPRLAHLIPTASHERFLIKTSFHAPLVDAPRLKVGDRLVAGSPGGTSGRFFRFDVDGLKPQTEYILEIIDRAGKPLGDRWALRTLPSPDAPVSKLRILTFTSCGGDQIRVMPDGQPYHLPMVARHALLDRALSFRPDVFIANGDHIYWDQDTTLNKGKAMIEEFRKLSKRLGGTLDKKMPVLGTRNEEIFLRGCDAQIAQLYEMRMRSIPSFFIGDDHDLFENDEAEDFLVTLPPDYWMMDAARSTQLLYYPEFLPDPHRPFWMPGSNAPDREKGLSESFGTLRYGTLLEALLYDCKRHCTIKGPAATMVPVEAERWLAARTAAEETLHLFHSPSTPFGWTAGKWGEPYPDVIQRDGKAGTEVPKPYWPPGWWNQHQRILKMLGGQKKRAPLLVQGDLHAIGWGKILKSGELDFRTNPIFTVLIGPLATGTRGFPSVRRGSGAVVPSQLVVEETVPPIEKNAFTLIDVTPEKMVFRFFAWRPPEPMEKITDLEPFHQFEIGRKG